MSTFIKLCISLCIIAVFPACAYHSPGAKVSVVITTNASLTPTGAPIIP